MAEFRTESDSMGTIEIPKEAMWGAQTQRAIENFSISPLKIHPEMLKALGIIKAGAANTNRALGLIENKTASMIEKKALCIFQGKYKEHFPLDVFQTGSGTSWNMNVNEVISNLSNIEMGSTAGTKSPVHPNDHVNKGQSSNDVIPSAINISNRILAEKLVINLKELKNTFAYKVKEFSSIYKLGRTHLQDAVPMTLGQEFSAYEKQIENSIKRIRNTFGSLEELALGGTALGTGLNAHKDFANKTIAYISEKTKISFKKADNFFEAISARDPQLELMGAINSLAVSLMKIAQDLRILSSGPRAGFGEISLPSLQPGSSIMPGKVNPVIPEMMIQVCANIMGKYSSTAIACQNSPLQLNIMQPLLSHETNSSMDLLINAVKQFEEKCIKGIEADAEKCLSSIEWSLAIVTPLAIKIGYDKAAKIAYRAYKEKKKVRTIVLEEGILTEKEADEVFEIKKML